MRIRHSGNPSNISKEEAKYAATWMLKKLVGQCLADKLFVYIKYLDPAEHDPELYANAYGLCWSNSSNNRKFKILVSPTLRHHEHLYVLGHELCHVAQYASNKLREKNDTHSIWKSKIIDEEAISHDEKPWEIEAHERSRKLVKAYKKHKLIKSLTF